MDDIINYQTIGMSLDTTRTERRVQRVRHELKLRRLEVTQVRSLGPGFVAVTLGGAELEGFTSMSFDDHVKLFLEGGPGEPVRRDYTPRHHDPARGELTLELFLHGHGAASDWARRVQPGDAVAVGGPRGSLIIPADYGWHLLAGDASALPAIHRRLEELPAGARAIVLVELAEAADERTFDTRAALQVRWLRDRGQWLQALRALDLPAGDGFVWAAGEARTMAAARELLLGDKRHPLEAMRVSAYWKAGLTAFHETL